MKIWIVDDEYDYLISEDSWHNAPSAEITDEEYKRYVANCDEKDKIQAWLKKLYKDNLPKPDYSKGIKPKPFFE